MPVFARVWMSVGSSTRAGLKGTTCTDLGGDTEVHLDPFGIGVLERTPGTLRRQLEDPGEAELALGLASGAGAQLPFLQASRQQAQGTRGTLAAASHWTTQNWFKL